MRLLVLRVTFNDPDETSLYLDAHDGQQIQRELKRTRTERLVYHGFHSLDLLSAQSRPQPGWP